MSYAQIDTRNRIGVRRSYSRSSGLGVHRAPAETPPVSAYYPTRPLNGVRDYNTQSAAHSLRGVVDPWGQIEALRFVSPTLTPTLIVRSNASNGTPVLAAPIFAQPGTPTPPSTASQSTATPTTTSTTPAPTGVAITSGGPAAATAQAGTPVPVG